MPAILTNPNAKAAKLDNSDPLCSVEEASEFLGLPKSTIYQLLDKGVIPGVNLPGVGTRRIRRIRKSALLAYLASGSN
jgi:excisionase family DNA binding protein